MNWASVSFDWNQARTFLATAEEGSLSAAARALGQTQPTLGRQVAALEDKLGVFLFERVGKSLILTPCGLELLDHVRAMYDAANNISLAASGQSQAIDGCIRITASDVMSALLLPPVIEQIRSQAPQLEVEIVASNEIQDLQMREADIAIRHVRPEKPDLITKLIGEACANFYAADSYIEKHGLPASLEEAAEHNWIGFSDNHTLITSLDEMGIPLTPKNFPVCSGNGLVAWEMAKQGLGLIIMSDNVAEKSKGMKHVFPEMAPIKFPIWLTTHKELHTSRRIRLTFDILSDFLTNNLV